MIHEVGRGKNVTAYKKPIAAVNVTAVKPIVADKPIDVAVTTIATLNHHRPIIVS